MDIKVDYTNLDFRCKKEYIKENILIKYGDIVAKKASTPLSMSETSVLVEPQLEMCLEILDIWEMKKYNSKVYDVINNKVFYNKEKFVYKLLLGKSLTLMPAGVTIISIGMNRGVARRLTQGLGYAISELCQLCIKSSKEEKNLNLKEVFNKESIEDLMEVYLIEFNKKEYNK